MFTYKAATALVADQAKYLAEAVGIDTKAAVNQIARGLVARADEARTRTGAWSYETTTEKVDEALFYGMVANDILDGNIARPSIGNVRAHTLALATGTFTLEEIRKYVVPTHNNRR